MSRITGSMNTQEILIAMGGHNPGALAFMMECIKKGGEVDPNSALGGG